MAMIPPMLLGLWAQWRVKNAFGKFSRIRATSNVSGADAARRVLTGAQIHNVEVVEIDSMASPARCINEPSIAALGIAAHEAGHPIHDYLFLMSRDRD